MAKRKSSGRWLERQRRDPYVQAARTRGYRSRAALKLEQIDTRFHLLEPRMTVVELGAAPGGWTQYVARRLAGRGRVLAIDLLPMDPVDGAEVLAGDFTHEAVLREIDRRLSGSPVDAVLSDMAPNASGNPVIDQPRSLDLAECAHQFALERLEPRGSLVVKVFQGAGFEEFVAACRDNYGRVSIFKPRASRGESREVYVVGEGLHQASEAT